MHSDTRPPEIRRTVYYSPRRAARQRRQRRRRILMLTGAAALCLCACASLAGLIVSGLRNVEKLPAAAAPESMADKPAAVEDNTLRIAVDAGHGGSDIGAQGVVNESEMTEATARALIELLEEDERFSVVLCRDWDVRSTPTERGQEAARQGADLLLSIHGNSWEGSGQDVHGFECYPCVPGTAQYEESMRFAQLICDEISAAGGTLRGNGGIRYIYFDEDDNRTILEKGDETVTGMPTFSILEHAGCPAVLAEQCFVTSAADVDLFGDADGVQLAAQCYYNAICAWADGLTA